MRDIYPCFDLYIDGGMSSIYFYNALRFSTHGEYRVFVANENTDWFKPFPHHQLITNFDIGSLKLHSKESFNIKFIIFVEHYLVNNKSILNIKY